MIEARVKNAIRDIPDFPKKGILFKDITPIFQDPVLSRDVVAHLRKRWEGEALDVIAGIESRGFLFGPPLAMALGIPFILIRKKGKLPYTTVSHSYDLEYGQAEIEMHTDAVRSGDRVLIHDDLLATGGTALAAKTLLENQGAHVTGFSFLVELEALNGRTNLQFSPDYIHTLARW